MEIRLKNRNLQEQGQKDNTMEEKTISGNAQRGGKKHLQYHGPFSSQSLLKKTEEKK